MQSYVKWFESRGVRVIPIPFDTLHPELYFHSINGLVIPGGYMPYVVKKEGFMRNVQRFMELSMKSGEYFPIWSTCLGFEIIMFIIGKFRNLSRYDAHGMFPLQLTPHGRTSRMMGSFSAKYIHQLEHESSTLHNHEYGISPSDFMANQYLRRFYHILSTSVTPDGKEFVSAIEAKHYPIYGIQFHPERHKDDRSFIGFIIRELKKNRHLCPRNIPYLHTIHTARAVAIYPEKKRSYYFF